MYHHIRPHARQFTFYLLSGGSAAALELISYRLLLLLDPWFPSPFLARGEFELRWYIVAAFVSGIIGLASAFTFHKFFVFGKRDRTKTQVLRYAILQTWNLVAQTGLVYVFVDLLGIDPFTAKILGIGCTVLWNFFLYKFFVYA